MNTFCINYQVATRSYNKFYASEQDTSFAFPRTENLWKTFSSFALASVFPVCELNIGCNSEREEVISRFAECLQSARLCNKFHMEFGSRKHD